MVPMNDRAPTEPPAIHQVWEPIEAPTDATVQYESTATREFDALADVWRLKRARLEEVEQKALSEFIGRLTRSWAIETGVLERLYDLDEGATKSLVEVGLREELLERETSSLPPAELISILEDHVAAAEMVLALVSDHRPLSKQFLRELHALLMRRQETVEAVTPDGNRLEVAVLRGEFKSQPNNPLRGEGLVHEYAPPEQVLSELDALFSGFEALGDANVVVRAAWLHHRFTQIHPFQDGNGRVARALTNFVFIKANLFPLVVHRYDRVRYIESLEEADAGNLAVLIDFFAEVASKTLLEALAFLQTEEERGASATVEVLFERLAKRYGERITDRQRVLRSVNTLAAELRDAGVQHVYRQARANADRLATSGLNLTVRSQIGGPDQGNDKWWIGQLVELANEFGYWINFAEGQYWFRATLRGAPVQLTMVVSLHHVGHELTGVMRALAFAEFEAAETARERETEPEASWRERIRQNCTPRSFSITWQESVDQSGPDFEQWLNEALLVAIRRWLDLI